jgi:hypothetical protein
MNIRRTNGLTLIGFLIVLVVTLFFVYAGMRVVPMYLEYHALGNAMGQLEDNPASANLSPAQIKKKIRNSLWASYASNNIKDKHMRISKTTDGIKLRVAYEIREPFLGNIDIIGKFDRSVILRK